ncbi:phosphate/phosphite/phosphonate ABC transporter substrate-binding protein [Trichlorobacter sp.]|uniref:substrate-binding domain-containing protein n=1 Tax=Trichlorobacter sp. TaxID=2911007 RepID=UPI002A359D88|nr:phosphate/phosphite/phosphonate ABC transporter substrate-binding protein [Trichlorobacter sp.]MDY0384195.1 phosphate/phosphite/phosphonate ABC transporter substrate-binding protein [Trichlorobacter sp.]
MCFRRSLSYLALLVLVAACSPDDQQPVKVNLSPSAPTAAAPAETPVKPLRIGMGGIITPKEGYRYYQQLQGYLAQQLGQPVQLVDRANYEELNRLLQSGGIDAAFVCAGPYVEGKQQFDMQLIAMPLVNGKSVYHAYIIVHKDSPIQNLSQLEGKSFAFTDPKSNSGKLVPTYMLAQLKTTPERFFSRRIFTYGHDNSIKAVAERHVDGASVDSLIWDYTARKYPHLTANTRVIATSEPYGIPPVVVRPGIDPALKQRLQQALLTVHQNPEGKAILDGMLIDRFVPGDDRNYDSIRTMNRWLAGQADR